MARELSRFAAELRRQIHVGTGRYTGEDVFLPLEELKKTSVHIVGAAGYGKSYLIRNLIRQFLRQAQPFALIDPHRELFHDAVCAVRRSSVPAEKVVLLDPGDDDYAVAFNPLSCGITDPAEASSLVLEAVLKAWGAESFDATPRMEGVLRNVFRILADNDLTMLEAMDVLNVDNVNLRRTLRERVSDDWVQRDLEELERWPRTEKLNLFESSRNRIRRFIQSDRLQRMLGQRERALDLQRVMDDGKILLANVGNTSSPETKRLLGALLVNGIYHAAKQRNPRRRRDYFLIIDECGQFATQDLANSLDELRKFGVHLVLAHQRLAQLEREDADILSAVMTNAKAKVVFGGLERREAERMAQELFTGNVRGDKVKHITMQTKFKPVFDTFEVETETWSDSDGESESSSDSETFSESRNESESFGYDVDDDTNLNGYSDDDVVSRTLSRGNNESRSRATSTSRNSQHSRTEGGSRSVVPITRHEEFQEETSRQFWSVEEQWEEMIAAVHRLGKREALIKLHDGPVVHIRTADVREESDVGALRRFKERVQSRCPNALPTAEVMKEIETRKQAVAALVEASTTANRPFEVKTFKER